MRSPVKIGKNTPGELPFVAFKQKVSTPISCFQMSDKSQTSQTAVYMCLYMWKYKLKPCAQHAEWLATVSRSFHTLMDQHYYTLSHDPKIMF